MKKTIIGLFAGAALIAGFATAAEAKANFQIYLGTPYYDHQVDPDYRFDQRYGWYRPGHRNRMRISCGEARRAVRDNGYRQVRTRECEGRTFTFTAVRNGRHILVYVNSRTGAVWRG